jgi:Ran-binding protein 9/10
MAILDGDVDKALKHTNAFYPSVLKDNEHIYFRLRSRKFVEMIRRAAEIRSVTINGSKKSNGHAGDWYDDMINHDMELDEPPVTHNGWDRMDTEGTHDSQADYTRLLGETIQYGQELQAEFQHDPRREVQKSLQDAFALLAYEDPINSKEVSHLLKREGRVSVAEELNAAILGTTTSLSLVIFRELSEVKYANLVSYHS